MRESRTFAERTPIATVDRTLKKYFLVYEGSDTEAIYFRAVNAMRSDIGIDPLIELVPIIRSYSEEGWSNPKKILDRVIEDLEESRTGCISYRSLLDRIMDHFYETGVITDSRVQAKSIWQALCKTCKEGLCGRLEMDVEDIRTACDVISKALEKEFTLPGLLTDIAMIIEEGSLTYAEGFDKICLIVDRDRKSFLSDGKKDQYEDVINICEKKGFGLYVTDPCFEFWLLLHFDEVFTLDRDKLYENPKVTAKKRYIEHELCRIWPGFTKSSYKAEGLIKDIDKAIQNEKCFCEDIEMLKDRVGSNVGRLIEEMRYPA